MNYNSQPLFSVIDTFDSEVYPMKEKDPDRFHEIMRGAYDQTHKTRISDQKLKEWSERFPNMMDRKMESEKHKLKKKLRDITRSRKSKERYKTSQLRNRNIMQQLESIGYFAINRDSKMAKMKAGLENDEIILDIIEEISDPYGSDHDMVEINYDDQFKRKVKEYEDRYKYVYVVEDIKPIEVKKIPKKKPISKAKPIPKKEERKTIETPVKKVKEKLFSSVILSKNPIKITPVEKLEHVKKKPTIKKKPIKKVPIKKKKPIAKAKPIVKKKPVVKKKPIKKAPIKKKKPPIKKKPIVKKKTIKKVVITKKKAPIKRKIVKKKKPLPKVKSTRAKRRNSPITGRWTARYRTISGKRRKVLIRRWKGKIQTRIIN